MSTITEEPRALDCDNNHLGRVPRIMHTALMTDAAVDQMGTAINALINLLGPLLTEEPPPEPPLVRVEGESEVEELLLITADRIHSMTKTLRTTMEWL